jgi:opacity protein-like surface antigen
MLPNGAHRVAYLNFQVAGFYTMKKMTLALLGSTVAVGLTLAGGSAFAADLMAPPPVEAAVVSTSGGGYISVFGGYSAPLTVNGAYTSAGTSFSAPFASGYIVGAAIGTHLGSNARFEGELSYASHAVGGLITFNPGGGPVSATTTTGNEATLYLLGNVWLDLNTGSGFTPYIGGGAGLAVIMPNVTYTQPGGGGTFNTTAYAPAAQLGVGVKFDVADNMSIDLGYRAKYVFNANLTSTSTSAGLSGINYLDQSVQIGLNIGF